MKQQGLHAQALPEGGAFEALVYGNAEAYVANGKYNKPGTIPLARGSEVDRGCPHDCGLCPDHQQHTCLGIIEVNSACNMNCPLCFSTAGPGFSLTLEEIEAMMDDLVRTECRRKSCSSRVASRPSIHRSSTS